MTTFHDLLGTTNQNTDAEVKLRYRHLSSKLHPDKGGTKALMQLLSIAYEKIQKGKGDEQVSSLSGIELTDNALLQRELSRLKRELEETKAYNTLLKSQLNEVKSGAKVVNAGISIGAPSASDLSRKLARVEGENVLLSEERRRLQNQVDGVVAEQKKLAGELRKVLSENELLETELAHSGRRPEAGLVPWARRFWIPMLTVFLGTAAIVGISIYSGLFSWLMAADIQQKPKPRVRIVHTEPVVHKAIPPKPESDRSIEKTSDNQAKPFIQLTDEVGVWALANYTVTNQPYIAIRSHDGSYVVNDCNGKFRFYLNEPYKPLRVAANLIYLHQNQHFYVYDIPYGQGSSSDSWLQSRKLKINSDSFTSQNFQASLSSLSTQCP